VSRRFFLLASSLMVLMTEAASRGAWAQSHSSPLPAPEARRNFLACPIVQDTPTVPCWLAEYHGELYFLGIQTDSAGWSPPYLGHRVLVEGALAGGPRICGGIPLTSKYPASPIPSGKANGRPLPNPPVVSVMRELDSSCNELRAADPQFQIEGRRGPGPNVPSAGFGPSTAAPLDLKPPFASRTFTLTYEFDSEFAARTIGEALKAVQYARAAGAKRMTIIGYRGATLLSDGRVLREIEPIGRLRAEELGAAIRKIGVPASTELSVRWESEARKPDGVTDPERRRAEILVQP
jgi:hypothetical protein